MKELESVLIALNSTDSSFKYPIGNKELTLKVRNLEHDGKIIYDPYLGKWFKRTNKISKQLRG